MGFFDIFRKPAPIRDGAQLADFIDRNAALLVQRGLYEYARARAGVYAKVLFTEKPFLELVENARWQAYPLGLAMVAEMVEGVLRGDDPATRQELVDALRDLTLQVFDRYPVPENLGAAVWRELRESLAQRLAQIGLTARKPAKDIPEPYVDQYFNLMPIHEKLKAMDYPAVRAYLKVSLCNIHDEFARRLDRPALNAAWGRAAQGAS